MRIAQVSPLYESVPPQLYGGTERVVSYLTEELVRQGHDVTLFAAGDSKTEARLIAPCPSALRLDPTARDPLAYHYVQLDQLMEEAHGFDVIHFHTDYLHFPFFRRHPTPHLTTLHGRLDLDDLQPLYRRYGEMPLVSISNAQRRPLQWANWQRTIYHGLPEDLFSNADGGGKYLAFLGRICAEKRLDRAIEIATRAGVKLKVAAKIDAADRDYFKEKIEPLLDNPLVECIGEIGDSEKQKFLGDALALLFPIDWPEPFGLVLIEAMACGTPIITWRRGSVPELVDEGVTGFIVERIDQAVAAVNKIDELSRARCRATFEQRFTVERMATEYLDLYERLIRIRRKCLPRR